MTQEEFSRAFKASPMKRAKLRGLKRNAAVVLGNVGRADDVPALEAALDDPEPLVREHAPWALERLRGQPTGTRERGFNGYIPHASPTVLRDGPFRLFFVSREEARMHVHVAHPDGEAKFWLDPAVSLAVAVGMSPRLAAEAETVVRRHEREVRDAWARHFGR